MHLLTLLALLACPTLARAQTKILLVGDSNTSGGYPGGANPGGPQPTLDSCLTAAGVSHTIFNEGRAGYRNLDWLVTNGSLSRLGTVCQADLPNVTVILMSTNDINTQYEPTSAASGVAYLGRQCETDAPGSKTIIVAIPPDPLNPPAGALVPANNVRLQAEAALHGWAFTNPGFVESTDMSFDLIHLNTAGFTKLGNAECAAVLAVLNPPPPDAGVDAAQCPSPPDAAACMCPSPPDAAACPIAPDAAACMCPSPPDAGADGPPSEPCPDGGEHDITFNVNGTGHLMCAAAPGARGSGSWALALLLAASIVLCRRRAR